MATENQYNSFNQSNSHGQSPPPYTPRVVVTRFTSDSFNVRDKIEQLENENKKLTRQVKICRGRLGLIIGRGKSAGDFYGVYRKILKKLLFNIL